MYKISKALFCLFNGSRSAVSRKATGQTTHCWLYHVSVWCIPMMSSLTERFCSSLYMPKALGPVRPHSSHKSFDISASSVCACVIENMKVIDSARIPLHPVRINISTWSSSDTLSKGISGLLAFLCLCPLAISVLCILLEVTLANVLID